MNSNRILTKVYSVSAMMIASVMLLICLLYKWPLMMIVVVMLACIVISSPATISLQLVMWLTRTRRLERSFVWMLLMASIPLLALATALLFAGFVPGKVWSLLAIGMTSGYISILGHGLAIARFFNSKQHEGEENHTID